MARRSMREEIVGAGLRRFHELGYHAAGVKEITDAAGVPKGSFYNHFGSKEALAVETLQRYGESLHLETLSDASVAPRDRIRALFERLRDRVLAADCRQGCLLGNLGVEVADHSEEIRTAVADGWRAWTGLLEGAIAETGAPDPGTRARFLIAAWEGTLIEARLSRSEDAFAPFFAMLPVLV